MSNRHRPPPQAGSRDALAVLAAVARAERHRADAGTGASVREIRAHLGVRARSRAAGELRRALAELCEQGLLARSRRHGASTFSPTRSARRRLRRARPAPALPESPQHARWREARAGAAPRLESFRAELAAALEDAGALLAAEPPPHSDAFFEAGERLARAAWLLGSAHHCLYEWEEPADERADVDSVAEAGDAMLVPGERRRVRARRKGRRNIALWDG